MSSLSIRVRCWPPRIFFEDYNSSRYILFIHLPTVLQRHWKDYTSQSFTYLQSIFHENIEDEIEIIHEPKF